MRIDGSSAQRLASGMHSDFLLGSFSALALSLEIAMLLAGQLPI